MFSTFRSFTLLLSLVACKSFSLDRFLKINFQKWKREAPVVGVRQTDKNPVLTVLEPDSQCTVHLVGVSHGAQSSAELVERTMKRVKPSTVILELCDERYLSICLEHRINPKVNATLTSIYNSKLADIQARKAKQPDLKGASNFAAIASNFNFLKSQGLFVGAFISMGLFVSSLQKFLRPVSTGDEFTTAMRTAESLNIPVRLGDAKQSATLQSLQKVVSFDTINPKNVINGAKSLAFSGLGMNVDEFLGSEVEMNTRLEKSLEISKWISIPVVYAQNRAMMKSLIPLVVVTAVTTLLGNFPLEGHAADMASLSDTVAAVSTISGLDATASQHVIDAAATAAPTTALSGNSLFTGLQTAANSVFSILSNDLNPEVEGVVNLSADALSALLLIRLAKIIGSDRDRIIASKIQATCKEFSGSDVVVVIGMLHCNGVARWLLSGQDPLLEK